MGIHERCVECGGDCCTEVDRGETCRNCLKKRIEELEVELTQQTNRAEWWKDDVQRRSRRHKAKLKSSENVVEAVRGECCETDRYDESREKCRCCTNEFICAALSAHDKSK